MQETEKRVGLPLRDAHRLKDAVDGQYRRTSVVNRTVVVKVDNDDFSPDPDTLVDIKSKLIGDQALLSVKYGSWHGDCARQEYEVRFHHDDLGHLLAILKLFGHSKFIVLATVRTTWIAEGVVITLDEYHQIGQALFEVELQHSASGDEDAIDAVDAVFKTLGTVPMTSEQTIEFISRLNRVREIQIDLDTASADQLAERILAGHTT